jgi:hypothetical protein
MHRHILPSFNNRLLSYSNSCTDFHMTALYTALMCGGLAWKTSQNVKRCSLSVRSEASTLAYSSMMMFFPDFDALQL